MPIDTPTEPAVQAAEREALFWVGLASHWAQAAQPQQWSDRPAREVDVVVFHDPAADLDRRASRWGHALAGHGLDALALFAAGLARAEADAWQSDQPDVAMRAFEDRRFLLADRVIHWAVPWLDTMSRRHPEARDDAEAGRDGLLELAEALRPAPRLTGPEGVYPRGEDAYGPVDVDAPLPGWLDSLWSGSLLVLAGERGGERRIDVLAAHYETESARWRRLSDGYPGSSALWVDLADRAARTAKRLRQEPIDSLP